MPSEKVMEKKKQEVEMLTQMLKDSCAGVLVDYKGIPVSEDTALRAQLRAADVQYHVVKNTLLNLAVKNAELDELANVLSGTTAIATSKQDYVAAARILSGYAATHKNFSLKSGFIDGRVINEGTLAALAKLPSREVLLATVCNAFNAPIAAFARAVQAIADKQGETAA
ncbi:MAG TPA: 50S ribosomal protein L10 [Clostridiales bacterium]|nr:50S ribosomal protein L10 [Clostridiales bacterium]